MHRPQWRDAAQRIRGARHRAPACSRGQLASPAAWRGFPAIRGGDRSKASQVAVAAAHDDLDHWPPALVEKSAGPARCLLVILVADRPIDHDKDRLVATLGVFLQASQASFRVHFTTFNGRSPAANLASSAASLVSNVETSMV